MNKFRKELALVGILSVLLSGCSMNAIPDMTEEETQQVEEYAAQLLLQYDANYEPATLTAEEKTEAEAEYQRRAELEAEIQAQKEAEAIQAAEEAAAEENASTSPDGSQQESTTSVYTDIDEFLEINGLSIDYVNYEICSSYPASVSENDWQGVARATGSNQLVVFHFSITNQSGSDYYLDMASMNTRFTFKVNGSVNKTAITTLLENDMILYRDTIPNGATIDTVMIIELSPEDAEAISSVSLIMKYNGKNAESTLL